MVGFDNGDNVGALGACPDALSGLVHSLFSSCELCMLAAKDSELPLFPEACPQPNGSSFPQRYELPTLTPIANG